MLLVAVQLMLGEKTTFPMKPSGLHGNDATGTASVKGIGN